MWKANRSNLEKPSWKKVLYIQQPYPDNYVSDLFLEDLKKNLNFRRVKYSTAVLGALCVVQQMACAVELLIIFEYLSEGIIQPLWLLFGIVMTTSFGYIWGLWLNFSAGKKRSVVKDLNLLAFFVTCGVISSPVLATLTDSISTDTIYALSFAMLTVHVAVHNYGCRAAVVSAQISLNAGLFGALCLASRLPSSIHVFALLTCAIELFALMPMLRNEIIVYHRESVLASLALTHSFISLMLTWICQGGTSALLLLITYIMISLVLPRLFVNWQKYKDNIYGPWDEAVIENMKRTIEFNKGFVNN